MAHAETCPVCFGKGKLKEDNPSSSAFEKTCHGCWGRGWITIQDSNPWQIWPKDPIEDK